MNFIELTRDGSNLKTLIKVEDIIKISECNSNVYIALKHDVDVNVKENLEKVKELIRYSSYIYN